MTPPASSEAPPTEDAATQQMMQMQQYQNMPINSNPMTSNGYYDPNERMDPINYDDPNDHRNYINGPDLGGGLPPIGNGMTYHDFEYIGY